MIPSDESFCGCLIGQCLGDALGFLVEGEPPSVCADYARAVVLSRKRPQRRRQGFAFGQYSDDSQLARELMISYRTHAAFDPADYAGRIATLFAQGRVVGHGQATSAAAARLWSGTAWDQAGTPAPSAGNGSAMRAGPVGLLFGHQPEALLRVARDQGRITHADPRCVAGSVTVAAAVSLAARGGAIDRQRFVEALGEVTVAIEPTTAAGLRRLLDLVDLPVPEAAAQVARLGLPPGVDSHWRGGISAFVLASVLWALYAFLRSPEDYVETIATAIAPGGDVDTTAAMAGAISGAHLGLAAIPPDLARRLNDRGTWAYDELIGLALDCGRMARG